jgi:hypothetical protein
MKVREAKDFLVQQTAEQAAIEKLPFSDLEKRMMYFTEGKDATEDPTTLNDEFEAQYDSAKYEKKISRLMHHAYKRLRKEGSSALRTWDDAIRRLKRGDHYLIVLWGERPGSHTTELIGLGIGLFILAALYGLRWITHHVPPPNPQLMLTIFIVVVLAILFFRRATGNAVGWLLDKTLFRLAGGKEDEEE